MSLRPSLGNGHMRARDGESCVLQSASWLDGAVCFDRRSWAGHEVEFRWQAPSHVLVLTEYGSTARTRIHGEGRWVYDGCDRPGSISFVPAGLQRGGVFQDADLVYSALWIDPSVEIPGCAALADEPMRVNADDGVLRALLQSLSSDVVQDQTPDTLYLEHLIGMLALRLGRTDTTTVSQGPQRKLGNAMLARVTDYIEAHMATGVSLGALAELAGMSADNFARRFKAQTGMAPYAYVLDRKVRQAKVSLASSDAAISDIALALGFSSQSHFTSTFQRITGMTPRQYRLGFSRDPGIAA